MLLLQQSEPKLPSVHVLGFVEVGPPGVGLLATQAQLLSVVRLQVPSKPIHEDPGLTPLHADAESGPLHPVPGTGGVVGPPGLVPQASLHSELQPLPFGSAQNDFPQEQLHVAQQAALFLLSCSFLTKKTAPIREKRKNKILNIPNFVFIYGCNIKIHQIV